MTFQIDHLGIAVKSLAVARGFASVKVPITTVPVVIPSIPLIVAPGGESRRKRPA